MNRVWKLILLVLRSFPLVLVVVIQASLNGGNHGANEVGGNGNGMQIKTYECDGNSHHTRCQNHGAGGVLH